MKYWSPLCDEYDTTTPLLIWPYNTLASNSHSHDTSLSVSVFLYMDMMQYIIYIYINTIFKITKSANIQVNTNITKLAQMKTLRFWRLTWWSFDTWHPLSLLNIVMHSVEGEAQSILIISEVVSNSVCTGDLVDTVQLARNWVTHLPSLHSVNTNHHFTWTDFSVETTKLGNH